MKEFTTDCIPAPRSHDRRRVKRGNEKRFQFLPSFSRKGEHEVHFPRKRRGKRGQSKVERPATSEGAKPGRTERGRIFGQKRRRHRALQRRSAGMRSLCLDLVRNVRKRPTVVRLWTPWPDAAVLTHSPSGNRVTSKLRGVTTHKPCNDKTTQRSCPLPVQPCFMNGARCRGGALPHCLRAIDLALAIDHANVLHS